jgi:hypothetical protein
VVAVSLRSANFQIFKLLIQFGPKSLVNFEP